MGRKLKFAEETTTITVRVPLRLKQTIKNLIYEIIKKYVAPEKEKDGHTGQPVPRGAKQDCQSM